MSYELQNFISGEVLYAARLNSMDRALKNAFEEQDTKRESLLSTLTPNDQTENNKYVSAVKIENGKIKTEKVEIPPFVLTSTFDGVRSRVTEVENTLSVLTGNQEGSINSQINTAIASIVAGADASLDTLKEIADWIGNDITRAAELANKVSNNETNITHIQSNIATANIVISTLTQTAESLQQSINKVETDYKAADQSLETTLSGNITSQISALQTEINNKFSNLSNLYDAKNSASQAQANANQYTDRKISELSINSYVTLTELESRNYLTEHQSLANYVKTSDVYTKSQTYTKSEVNTLVSPYSELSSKLEAALTRITTLETKVAELEAQVENLTPKM